MATLTPHAPGTFSWPELGTTDQDGAKKFYTALFGWTANDTPMGPGETYTIFQKNGKDVSALYTLRPEQKKMNVPPNWGAYISVTNADEAAAKAKQLGGTVLAEPFDVMEHGRMAIIQDPNGAVFQVWQAKQHIGAGVIGEPYTLCWTELMTPDPAKSKAFYTGLIGYTTEDMPVPGGQGTYTIFKRADGTQAAGMMKIPDQMKGVPSHWLSYFAVEDIQATVGKLTQIGGKVQVPPTPIPGIGTFSVVQDPQGAYFAMLQPPTS
jgi:predicted enzyme related to lactoylglutathione lyase